ncbi:MAG: hypothetical protein A2V91_00770 [Candidatus Muproteobacteria bacterium RBG_16_64_10]|uniref:SpoVT-AbrB domain-containing protein n=1 Tax=Candidatus Muproteobacteria bacterium RBG_16_64_10 TaxID=1817757 RepID=A0A1F6T1P4_9PROT|nr:MAG: hypothetical protein A2V91_00770 [Candidatus Muproteobacteria bacterium RBG_16_64_10]
MYAYITAKGRIVIPSEIWREFRMREGTRVRIDVDEQTRRIILTPITRERTQSLRGKYKGKGLLKVLTAEKKREKGL